MMTMCLAVQAAHRAHRYRRRLCHLRLVGENSNLARRLLVKISIRIFPLNNRRMLTLIRIIQTKII